MQKVIAIVSPLTFASYIIHVNPLIWEYFMAGRFANYAMYTAIKMFFAVVVTVIIMFVICCCVEWIRQKLFEVLKVHMLCERIEKFLQRVQVY